MKLIALVVEKYKDVFEKQIFNFSDEFTVDFDFNKRELSIKENEDYIPNFYSSSIYNITPIAGINGTGKSSILSMLSHYEAFDNPSLVKDNQGDYSYFILFQEILDSFVLESVNLRPNILHGIKRGRKNAKKVCESFRINKKDKELIYNNSEIKYSKNDGAIGFLDTQFYSSFKRYSAYKRNQDKDYYKDVFSRKLPELKLSTIREVYEILYSKGVLESDLKITFPIRIRRHDKLYSDKSSYKINLENREKSKEILDTLETIDGIKKVRYSHLNQSFVDTTITIKYNQIKDKSIENLLNLYHEYKEYQKKQKLTKNYFPNYELSMSSGEKNILLLVAQIYQIFSDKYESHHSFIILIDEFELGLHLEWSRKIIDFVIEMIEDIASKKSNCPAFQLIFTTHSPFMLSDIKPGNIIALKKNDKGYSEVQFYEKDKEKDKLENTFAKNIQEILRNNMFIENIYGEFAVQKINKIIDHLNSDDKYDEEQQHRLKKEILLISEPLIRDKLLDMYYQKYSISSDKGVEKFLQSLNSLQLEQTQLDEIKKAYEKSL